MIASWLQHGKSGVLVREVGFLAIYIEALGFFENHKFGGRFLHKYLNHLTKVWLFGLFCKGEIGLDSIIL